jgi:hypothetical protein
VITPCVPYLDPPGIEVVSARSLQPKEDDTVVALGGDRDVFEASPVPAQVEALMGSPGFLRRGQIHAYTAAVVASRPRLGEEEMVSRRVFHGGGDEAKGGRIPDACHVLKAEEIVGG